MREAIRAALQKMTANAVETNWSMAGPDSRRSRTGPAERSFVTSVRSDIETPDWAVFRAVLPRWRPERMVRRRIGCGESAAGSTSWSAVPVFVAGAGDPETVGYGEALDFWRVVGFEQDKRLALRAEMKLPGEALIEFRLKAAVNTMHVAATCPVSTTRLAGSALLVRGCPVPSHRFSQHDSGHLQGGRGNRQAVRASQSRPMIFQWTQIKDGASGKRTRRHRANT